MTRASALKMFFFKSIVPLVFVLLLVCIFKSACMKNGDMNYVWLWILCGLPFGLHRMCFWIVPSGSSMANFISQGLAILVLGGVIGGFVLTWKLIVAVWYIPLTAIRLLRGPKLELAPYSGSYLPLSRK